MIKDIIQGSRPKTLVAAAVPPVCAHALFIYETGQSSYYYMTLCLALALFIQIATNFYNDAVDFVKGADDQRVGPARITAHEKFGHKRVMLIGHISLICALLVGIPLVLKGGPILLVLGAISFYFAYGYTGGPFPLAYLGLGEMFVFLFFGLLATCGSYYVYANSISLNSWLLACQIGCLSCILIAVNNFRDRFSDKIAQKRTLATKMSERHYLRMIDAFIFIPYFIMFIFVLKESVSFIYPLLAISFGHKTRDVLRSSIELKDLNKALKFSGIHLMAFGILFSMGCLWK